MAQSWGRSRARHWASEKPGCSAPGASPLKNRQSSLKLRRRSAAILTEVAAWATGATQLNRNAHAATREGVRNICCLSYSSRAGLPVELFIAKRHHGSTAADQPIRRVASRVGPSDN